MKNNKFLIVMLTLAICTPKISLSSQSWSDWAYSYMPSTPSFSGLQEWANAFVSRLSENKIEALLGAIVAILGINYVRKLLQMPSEEVSNEQIPSKSEKEKIIAENINMFPIEEIMLSVEAYLFMKYQSSLHPDDLTLEKYKKVSEVIVTHFISMIIRPYKFINYINFMDDATLIENAKFYARLLQEEGIKRSHAETLGYKGYLMTYQYLELIGNKLAKMKLDNDLNGAIKKKILRIINETIKELYKNYQEAKKRTRNPETVIVD